jgi:hypothetical protein
MFSGAYNRRCRFFGLCFAGAVIFSFLLIITYNNSSSYHAGDIVVMNDVNETVWVKWWSGDQILHETQLTPQESDRYPSNSREDVTAISTQYQEINQSQWVDLLFYNISRNVYDATYTVSQLRDMKQIVVTNDLDDDDVRVTYMTENDTLCEVKLISGQSSSCLFHSTYPITQILTLVCDQNITKWSTPCYYSISDEVTKYNVSQIRQLETADCFSWEGMSC